MKKTIGFLLMLLTIGGLVFGQDQYKRMDKLGVAPLSKTEITSIRQVEELLTNEASAIEFLLSNDTDLIASFREQISGAVFKLIEIKSGEKWEKMLYKWNNKPCITERREWVGVPFMAYAFSITHEYETYYFFVPQKCGNITFWRIEPYVVQESPKIEQRQVIERPLGPVLQSQPAKLKDFFEPEPMEILKPVQMNFFAGVGIGGFYSCFMEYGIVELGVRRHISSETDLLGSIGYGIPIGRDKNGWYGVPMINLDLIGMFFEPVYIGVGVGFSGKMKEGQESQLEYGPDAGFRIKNWDFSLRGRIPFKGDPRGIRGNYKILLVARIFF